MPRSVESIHVVDGALVASIISSGSGSGRGSGIIYILYYYIIYAFTLRITRRGLIL